MLIQKIYKSRTPLVSISHMPQIQTRKITFNSTGTMPDCKQKRSLALFAGLSIIFSQAIVLTPDAVAKQVEQMDTVISLSQVQSLIPTVPVVLTRPKAKIIQPGRPPFSGHSKGRIPPGDHFRLGLALKASGNTNRALVEFLKATQKNPRQINAFYEQALIFRKQGYLKLADSSLEQALRIANSKARDQQRKVKPLFNANDLNRIRLLLATVRLEQGNVGSAAEELARSLGIALRVPPANADAQTNESGQEASTPTTILQSLHPVVAESRSENKALSTEQPPAKPAEEKVETTASPPVEKEDAAGATVQELIKEGLAGLKEHIFNPLSILGLPRISMDTEKTATTPKKGKRSRRRPRQESKPQTKDVETAKTLEKAPGEKRKRRGWLEKRLSITALRDIKPADMSVPVEKENAEAAKTEKPAATSPVETVTAANEQTENHDKEVLTEPKEDSVAKAEEAAPQLEASTFSLTMPPAISEKISLVAALLSAFSHEKIQSSVAQKQQEKPLDPIEERLKYLAEHGTSSLKEGEAFMFSEESGEATLFMANGEVIRRTIAPSRGHEEVAQLRRPDILIPEELIYNLALMAKILPKQEEPKETVGELKETAPTLKMPAIIDKPHGFSDWLKGVLNL